MGPAMRAPLESSAAVIDIFVDEVEKMDGREEIVFLAASVMADLLALTCNDEAERAAVLDMAGRLFNVRHTPKDPKQRMH